MSRSEKPDMKERILETADRLFYLRGIRAVGVDTVAAEIGISKRTLYNHFPSKDALIRAYLERRFTRAPASDKPPVEQILGTFDRLERVSPARAFAAARSSMRSPNSAQKTVRSRRSRSPSRKAAASGFATCCCSSMSPIRKALRRSSRCWSTAPSRRTWCATIRRWRGRRSKRQRCCWQMPALRLAEMPRRSRNPPRTGAVPLLPEAPFSC